MLLSTQDDYDAKQKLDISILAMVLAEANDFRMLQGELLARLGEVESDRSQKMDYLQRSLTVFRDLGAVDRMREVQASVHLAVMGN